MAAVRAMVMEGIFDSTNASGLPVLAAGHVSIDASTWMDPCVRLFPLETCVRCEVILIGPSVSSHHASESERGRVVCLVDAPAVAGVYLRPKHNLFYRQKHVTCGQSEAQSFLPSKAWRQL